MDELDGSIHAADRQGGSTYKKLLKLQYVETSIS